VIDKVIPGANALFNALTKVGCEGPFEVRLSPEDGERLEAAVHAQTEVKYIPYSPDDAELLKTAIIAGVRFTWPATDRPSDV
jgi:hypothetical protein